MLVLVQKNLLKNIMKIEKHEMTENVKDFFEINDDKKYDDEWNYDQDEIEQLRIKIEEQQVENLNLRRSWDVLLKIKLIKQNLLKRQNLLVMFLM